MVAVADCCDAGSLLPFEIARMTRSGTDQPGGESRSFVILKSDAVPFNM